MSPPPPQMPLTSRIPAQATFKSSRPPEAPPQPEAHFTVLIRLPFARGRFVDPPQVEWHASKDRTLWKIISRSPKTSDLDWEDLAAQFQVSPAFMLQQAAWLYERHLSHVRAQMRKVGSSNITNAGGGFGSGNAASGGVPMKRLESGGTSRTPSVMSMQSKESSVPRVDGSTPTPSTPRLMAPSLSRSPSTATVTQSRANITALSPRKPLQPAFRPSFPPVRRSSSPSHDASTHVEPAPQDSPSSPSAASSDSSLSSPSESDDAFNAIRRSQIFKRPPRFKPKKAPLSRVTDEEGEDYPEDDDGDAGFLPFADTATRRGDLGIAEAAVDQDPNATLRDPIPLQRGHAHISPPSPQGNDSQAALKSLTSSSSSAVAMGAPGDGAEASIGGGDRRNHRMAAPGPLSPRHRAELARLSPRQKGKAKEGSDGTPSMGSSFSDLDDASVTQSALEEALLSNMQHGRMSTFSQLRSRYL